MTSDVIKFDMQKATKDKIGVSELIHRYLLDNAMFRKLPREQKLIICFEGAHTGKRKRSG